MSSALSTRKLLPSLATVLCLLSAFSFLQPAASAAVCQQSIMETRRARPVVPQRAPDPIPTVESVEFAPRVTDERNLDDERNLETAGQSAMAEPFAPPNPADRNTTPSTTRDFYDPFAPASDRSAPAGDAQAEVIDSIDLSPAAAQTAQTQPAELPPAEVRIARRPQAPQQYAAPPRPQPTPVTYSTPPAQVSTLLNRQEPATASARVVNRSQQVPSFANQQFVQPSPYDNYPVVPNGSNVQQHVVHQGRGYDQGYHGQEYQDPNYGYRPSAEYPAYRPAGRAYGELTRVPQTPPDSYHNVSSAGIAGSTMVTPQVSSGITVTQLLNDASNATEETQLASFLVSNTTADTARDVNIEFSVEGDASIESIAPFGSVLGQRRARVRIPQIAAGQSEQIAVGLHSRANPNIVVRTRLITESVQTFGVTNQYVEANQAPLDVNIEGPEEVVVGETATFRAVVRNATTETINKPYLILDPDSGVELIAGDDAIQGTGQLAPGQKMEAIFRTVAAEPGNIPLVLTAGARGITENRHRFDFAARVPAARITVEGPELVGIGQEADFGLRIENRTLHPLTSVQVTMELPDGFDVTILDRDAATEPEENKITWYIPVIKTGFGEIIRFRGRGVANGQHNCAISVRMTGHPQMHHSFQPGVVGQSKIGLRIQNAPYSLPVETAVGVTLMVENHNIREDRGVSIDVKLPEGVEAYPSDLYDLVDEGRTLAFRPFDLPSGGGQKIVLYLVGHTPGTKALKASVTSGTSRDVNATSTELMFHSVPNDAPPIPVPRQPLIGSTLPNPPQRF